MQLRINVLTLMCLLGGLFSCSQEEQVEIPDNKQTCDVSLVLSMGDMQTKAASDYAYATEEELSINHCHVAVFELDNSNVPTNRIYYQDFVDMGELSENVIASLSGYTLTLQNVRTFGKEPKKVRVLIVANADGLDFSNWTTYNQYVNGELTTSSFTASTLVKTGISEVATLIYGQANAAISVELNQLSAKIEYQGVYDGEEKDTSFRLTGISGINTRSQVAIFDTNIVENTSYVLGKASTEIFYTYEIKDANKNIELSIRKGNTGVQKFPFDASKFVKGNLYRIRGNYTPSISFNINWEVIDMGKQTVNIPSFE